MINIEQSQTYVEDLKDDILANNHKDLYDFIEYDPVKAFWTAYLLLDMFKHEDLEQHQYLLYSKQLRHVQDTAIKYLDQLEFWETKYKSLHSNSKVTEILNYILNNIICVKDSDILDIALHFGKSLYKEQNSK